MIPICQVHQLQSDLNKLLFELLLMPDNKHPVRPSGLMNCARQIYYKYKNWKKEGSIPFTPMGVRKLLTFNRGHRVEKQVGEWLARLPGYRVVEYKKQIPICTIKKEEFGGQEDFLVSGEIDRFIVSPDGSRAILDVKSVAERTFLDIHKSYQPKDSHYFQQQLYLHGMQKVVKEGILYYENANTQAFLALRFLYNEEAFQFARARLVYLLQLLERPEEPNREYVFGEWQCLPQYCEFHDYCYSALKTKRPVPLEPNISWLDSFFAKPKPTGADRDQLIKNLQILGDTGTFTYKNKTLSIKKLKTKLQLEIT